MSGSELAAKCRAFWGEFPSPVRILLSHTFYCAFTDICFVALFWFVRLLPITGWALVILDQMEQIVLVVVTLYFALVTIYDLAEEKVRAIIKSFSRHAVFA